MASSCLHLSSHCYHSSPKPPWRYSRWCCFLRRQYAPIATDPSSKGNPQPSSQRHGLRDPSGFPSSGPIDLPSSIGGSQAVPAPCLTTQAVNSEAEVLTRVIWGTNGSLSESITSFTNFMRNFKIKYRVSTGSAL